MLKLNDPLPGTREPGRADRRGPPPSFSKERQLRHLGPKFERLANFNERVVDPLQIRRDPDALAPESLLVFEFSGSVRAFEAAVRSVRGLEWVGEDDEASLDAVDEEEAGAGVVYLAIPDQLALSQLERLWAIWRGDGRLPYEHRHWETVFEKLRDLRRWGPRDRVSDEVARAIILDAEYGEPFEVEVELVFRADEEIARRDRQIVIDSFNERGAEYRAASRVSPIGYDALLFSISPELAIDIANRNPDGLAGLPSIYLIQPQSNISAASTSEAESRTEPPQAMPEGDPIVAVLDGLPMVNHEWLEGRIILDDPDSLGERSIPEQINHGTAMASLIIHGDLQSSKPPLTRPIYMRPILVADQAPFNVGEPSLERLPRGILIVDTIVRAVHRMKRGDDEAGPAAPRVLVVNLSFGDSNRPFLRHLSALARAIDWLSAEYGVTFTVSAGNVLGSIELEEIVDNDSFSAMTPTDRAVSLLRAIDREKRNRGIIAPAEALNALTVGALHDGEQQTILTFGIANYDPYPDVRLPNPSSRMGLGYRNGIKPEILLPGGKERISSRLAAPFAVTPRTGQRLGGLKVAAPGVDAAGLPRKLDWSGGTSAATALATRAQHLIHDAMLQAYPEAFGILPDAEKALILKALVTHRARWPEQEEALIEAVIGPVGARKWQARRTNVMRLLGYGIPDIEEALGCIDSRATLWSSGQLEEDRSLIFSLPLPPILGGATTYHAITATLAWFTPTVVGRQMYRGVRLTIEEPNEAIAGALGMTGAARQPDRNAINRGTIVHRRWDGERAAAIGENGTFEIRISRKPDFGAQPDGSVPFGLAVSIEAPNIAGIYQSVESRIVVKPRIEVPTP